MRRKEDSGMNTRYAHRFFFKTLFAAWACFGLAMTAAAAPQIRAALQPYVASNWLAGAVAVVVDTNGIVSADAVGYADRERGVAMETNALFWIASMTKPFTAVSLMMLADEGKVSLDDPVTKYIPEMGNLWVTEKKTNDTITLRRPVRPITLRHLLSHTSGLPFLTPILSADLTSQPVDQQVLSFTMNPLEFQPGEGYRYSNEGIDTIGRVIEIASGTPYATFVQKRVLDPLGMTDTTFFPTSEQVKRLAKPYGANKEKSGLVETKLPFMKPPFDRTPRYAEAGGGLFSTGTDLARFCQMLLNRGVFRGQRLLSEKAFVELTKIQTGLPDKKYGLGFSVNPDGDGAFGHGGAAATNMTMYPKNGLALIWLVQVAGGYPGHGDQAQGAFKTSALGN
jgi:CubicO group peptidase (beta-lactamase class C family)